LLEGPVLAANEEELPRHLQLAHHVSSAAFRISSLVRPEFRVVVRSRRR